MAMGFIFIVVANSGKANNIAVSGVTLTGQNTSAGANNANNFTYIEFDLTWENSWRTSSSPVNWDAAWVFVKFRTVGTSTWQHVRLAPSGHNSSSTTPTTSYSVRVGLANENAIHNASTNPAVGAFIYRSANGTGTFSANDIRLKWFYRDNGVGDNDIVDVEVYAIEMVNVPQGSFWLGDNGNWGRNQFYAYGVSGTGYQITSEGSLAYYTSTFMTPPNGVLYITGYSLSNGQQTMDASYPKGFASFYCMKYECSQQLYVDFLNSLTTVQQSARQPAVTSNRINITSTSGVYSTTTPFVPVGYVDVFDLMAFMDWAGLRPMSELEYEKACRGTASPVTNEYAWGTTTLTNTGNTYTGGGTSSEVSTTVGANAAIRSGSIQTATNGPIRCGAFATSSTTRETAGASFYGIMELSGNQAEPTVLSAHVTFNGKMHGNGTLHSGGNADISDWPGFSSGTNSTGAGTTFWARGGSWDSYYYNNADLARVADRQNSMASRVNGGVGIRGGRSESTTTTVETK